MTQRARRILLWGVGLIPGFVGLVVLSALTKIPPVGRHYRPTFENAGIKYALDYKRALAQGKLERRPVLLYFIGENCVNARKMEIGVLSSPLVTERLRKFACSAVFVDHVPFVATTEASRLHEENRKLQLSTGDVSLPKFVVVSADFDLEETAADENVIARIYGYRHDGSQFAKFLDDALAKWGESRQGAE